MKAATAGARTGVLGDTPRRDYSNKLQLFNHFAAPELQAAIAALPLRAGMHVLDAGCGTGEVLCWLQQAVAPDGLAVGIDLSAAHLRAAQDVCRPGTPLIQADLTSLPMPGREFDLIWCANTLHHLPDPAGALRTLTTLLRPAGRIVLVQSALLPDLCFAWDSRLERAVAHALLRYYQQRYAIPASTLCGVRALVGLARAAPLENITARTVLLERIAPLGPADRRYLTEAVFRDTWGARLQPFLDTADFDQLSRFCDPDDPSFVLRRPDFHYMQSLTFVSGTSVLP